MSDIGPIGTFDLIDHHGRPASERTFLGRPVLVLFGFTHCRVVCPRLLSKTSGALGLLGRAAAEVAPLYITVDPARDTPSRMGSFLSAWPRFIGLTGTDAQISRAKESFRVFARKRDGADGDYEVPHSALTHLLDRRGRPVDHWGDHLALDEVAGRIRRHLDSASTVEGRWPLAASANTDPGVPYPSPVEGATR